MHETLYAGVLHLTPSDCIALRVTDQYSLHRVVYSLFEDSRTASEKVSSVSSGIQFADLGADANGRKVMLLSSRPPAESVPGGYGQVLSKPLPTHFLSFRKYRFSVIVNPVIRNGQSRKLEPVKGREAIAEWFLQRAQSSWGFSVEQETLQIGAVDVLRFKEKNAQKVTLAQVPVTGVLTVSDFELFKKSMFCGIGKGRAFGCGLLKIVPIQE